MNEVYTPPQSELNFKNNGVMGIIDDLAHQGTFRLLVLSIITLGIYTAFYIKRQSEVINNYVDDSAKISKLLVNTIFALAIISIPIFIIYFFVDDVQILTYLDYVGYVVDYLYIILSLVWAFKGRNRMNELLGTQNNESNWFNGIWTFIFQELYFNYKVNTIKDSQ